VDRFDPGPQPAGRAPAPGRLAYLQAFLNSFWDLEHHGRDLWATPRDYGAWLAGRGFDPSAGPEDLETAVELREALRALALANHDRRPERGPWPGAGEVVDRIAARVAPDAALVPRLGNGGARLDPTRDGCDGALALALGVALVAQAEGTWPRMKACPHARCGWVFYDHSRNRSSQWCSMRICGNRTKGELFRARRRVK
jgi:predicted RNA-binding Zn ribbon-like protein